MGLFDKVLKTEDEKLTERDGFVGIVLSAVAADGVVTDEEALQLSGTFARMRLFRDMRERDLRRTIERLAQVGQRQGPDALLQESARVVSDDLKPTAFAVAADLLLADGVVTTSERTYLEKLQKALGVPNELSLKIVDVMQVKNKG